MNEIVSLQLATWFHAQTFASAQFARALAKTAFNAKKSIFRDFPCSEYVSIGFAAYSVREEKLCREIPLIDAINQAGRNCSLEKAAGMAYLAIRTEFPNRPIRRI